MWSSTSSSIPVTLYYMVGAGARGAETEDEPDRADRRAAAAAAGARRGRRSGLWRADRRGAMTMMPLDFVPLWTLILGFGVFMYVLMDGFDLGVGILFRRAPSDADARHS